MQDEGNAVGAEHKISEAEQATVSAEAEQATVSAPKTLEELLKMSHEGLAKELLEAHAKIVDLEAYTSSLDGMADSLQRQLEEANEKLQEQEGAISVDGRLQEKERVIDALQVRTCEL
jgi:hypothetical protein